MKTILIILFSLTIIPFFVLADAQSETTIEAYLDKKFYTIADDIILNGKIIGFDSKIHSESPVIIQIWFEGNLWGAAQLYPNSDGTFSYTHGVRGAGNNVNLMRISFERSPVFETKFTVMESLMIIEVEPNPPGSDLGKEWVRLFNPTNKPIDLSGMIITSIHGDNNRHKLSGIIGPCDDLIVTFSGQFVDNEFDTLSIMYGLAVHSVDVTDEENDDTTLKIKTPECEGGQNKNSSSETQIDPPSMELEPDTSDESPKKIPDWVKNTMGWYAEGLISEDEIISAIKYLIQEGIIKLD